MRTNYEIGKCYRLLPNHYYFLPSLQECVCFKDQVAVRLTNFYGERPAFGKLVRIHKGSFFSDDVTDIEVELGELGTEYKLDDEGFNPLKQLKDYFS